MSILKRVLKSKLFNNIFYLFLLQGFGYIFPILLIPFLISTIGIEKYGLINFAIAFAWYFQVVSELGFDLSNVKHVVANKNNPSKLNEIFSSIITIRLFIALILFILYVGIILSYDKFREYRWVYLIAYIRVFSTAFLPYWLFRSLENVRDITKNSLFARTVSILPIFLLVREESDYIWAISFLSLNEVIAAILMMIKAINTYHLKICVYPFKRYIYYLKDTIPFFTSSFLIKLYSNSNIIILGFFTSTYWTGIYSASEKLYNAYNSIVLPLVQHVFYPYFMRIKNIVRINKMVLSLSVANVAFALILYLSSPYLLPIFIKTDYIIIQSCFNLFLIVICIDMPVDLLGYPYCGVTNRISLLNKVTLLVALLYIVGLVILITLNLLSVYSVIVLLIFAKLISLVFRLIILRRFLLIKEIKNKTLETLN